MSYFSFSLPVSLGRDFFYVSSLGQVVFCFLCYETQLLAGFLMSRLMAFLGCVQESAGLVLLPWCLAACHPSEKERMGLSDPCVPNPCTK